VLLFASYGGGSCAISHYDNVVMREMVTVARCFGLFHSVESIIEPSSVDGVDVGKGEQTYQSGRFGGFCGSCLLCSA
jgi:hypothetical protein